MHASKGKVLVAMSGGVDSSVAAAMLVREGYEVVGCFMRLGSPGETLDELMPADEACRVNTCSPNDAEPNEESRVGHRQTKKTVKIGHQGCCSINDAADARLVAAELGIPFYVCNFKKDFGRIIDYFVDEYAAGRTPNPCVRCNDWLKFGKLHEYATQIGADFIASGHYARVASGGWGIGDGENPRGNFSSALRPTPDTPYPRSLRLFRAVDQSKDQSYVLFGVPREQLSRMMLPIGGMQKPAVRALAERFGLPVFDKPDSQEICFVPDNDYAGLVESRRPELAKEGTIVDGSGRVVGSHAGQHRYTIGQRRGVGVAFGHPIYVVGKDPASNTITVGERESLLASSCIAGEANWLVSEDELAADSEGWFACRAKYRYNTPAVAAQARLLSDGAGATPSGRCGMFGVRFDEPQYAVAPGQAVVLYDAAYPEAVLGGGWIARSA